MPTTKDLLNNSTVKSMICCDEQAPAAEVEGDVVDMNGIGRKLLVIIQSCAAAATTTLSVVVQESATDSFGVEGAAATLDTFTTLDIVADVAQLVVGDLAPNERYVRVVATVGDATLDFAVLGVIYLERERPSGLGGALSGL